MVSSKNACFICLIRAVVSLVAVVLLSSCASSPTDEMTPNSRGIELEKSITKEGASGRSASYVLGAGDEMAISVWRNTDLSKTVTVDKTGSIDVPLAGSIKVSGLTLPKVKTKLVELYSEYLVNPKIDLSLVVALSQHIYVLGEVEVPGSLALERDVHAWEAVLMAGGFTDDANQGKVVLLRPGKEGEKATDGKGVEKLKYVASIIDLNIKKGLKDGKVGGQELLASGDIVYVPRSKIASAEAFMNRLNSFVTPISSIERMIIMGPDVIDVLKGDYESGGVIVAP